MLSTLVVLCALLAMLPSAAAAPSHRDTLLEELGDARILRHADGRLRFAGAQGGRRLPRPGSVGRDATPEQAARGFLKRYGSLFGIDDQASELRVARSRPAGQGRALVRFQQVHDGVPVIAGELNVQVDDAGHVIVANGEALPAQVDTAAHVRAAEAEATALALTARAHRIDTSDLDASEAELWVYDPALLGTPGGGAPRAVWWTTVSGSVGDPVDELVLIDAKTGDVALHFNQIAHGHAHPQRQVCDRNNAKDDNVACNSDVVATETNPPEEMAPEQVRHAWHHATAVHDYLDDLFGRDSVDGAGLRLDQIVRFCPTTQSSCASTPYPNAFWSSAAKTTVYGDGFASADDVVAHELMHGVTDHESRLFYWYQSGAINESMSDVFGELIDQHVDHDHDDDEPSAAWFIGEDAPDVFGVDVYRGALRSMANPPLFGHPDHMTSDEYHAVSPYDPATNAGFDNGGVHVNSGVGNKAAYLLAQSGNTPTSFNGTAVTPIGPEKTARIWYETNTNLLTSGSEYADLGMALIQACTNLTGVHGIVASDCTQVRRAVAATEMLKQPESSLARTRDAAPCVGGAPADLYYEPADSDAGTTDWTTVTSSGGAAWRIDDSYAVSAPAALWAPDVAVTSDARVAMRTAVKLPPNARMHFDHSFFTDADADATYGTVAYDGGVVEYRVAGGPWRDAKNLFSFFRYNAPLDPHDLSDNVLGGGVLTNGQPRRMVFGGSSNGWSSSMLNLATLAGKNVQFRFRFASDSQLGADGWTVDDVRIYRCRTDLAVSRLSLRPDSTTVGMQQAVAATIRNDGPDRASNTQLRFVLGSRHAYLGGPDGCRRSGGTPIPGGRAGGTVRCSTGTLNVGATASRTITVGVLGAGTATVSVTAAPTALDLQPGDSTRMVSGSATYPRGQRARCDRIGTRGANTLTGTSAANVICGFGGNDTIRARSGSDTVNGGQGRDRLLGQDGRDHLIGLSGRDRFNGGRHRDACPDRRATEPVRSCP